MIRGELPFPAAAAESDTKGAKTATSIIPLSIFEEIPASEVSFGTKSDINSPVAAGPLNIFQFPAINLLRIF